MVLEGEKLKEYINTAITLEASVYEQERLLDKAKANCAYHEPKLRQYQEPANPKIISVPDKTAVKNARVIIIIFAFFAFFGLASFIATGCYSREGFGDDTCVIQCLFNIVEVALLIYSCIRYRTVKLKYNNEVSKINGANQKARRDYNDAVYRYKYAIAEAKDDYRNAVSHEQTRVARAKEVCAILEKWLCETKDALDEYYSLDVIYPKYRTLAALCSFSEYFETGRCDELAGQSGAYNLYESELRQGLIISHLEDIANIVQSELSKLRTNQYILYTEIVSINREIAEFQDQIATLIGHTDSISESSALTAKYSKIAAENTKALMMIAAFKS